MKKRVLIASLMGLLSVLLFSCGGGGSPGSDSQSTNINIQAVTVTAETTDLDVFSCAACCDGDPEPGLTKNTATMNITAAAQNAQVNPFPGAITECTLTYKPDKADSPIIASWKIKNPNCIIVNGSRDCTIDLIDIDRKVQFAADAATTPPTQVPTIYRAHYDCTYQNNADKQGTLQGDIQIFLADFNLCG